FANKPLAKMARGHKFSFATRKRRIVDKNVHPDRRRIDVHELKRRAVLVVSEGFADINFLATGEPNNIAGGCMFDLDLLQSCIGKKRRDRSTFPVAIAMNADDRIADCDASADDTSERNSSKVIAVIQIRHEHLKKWIG